MSFCYLHFSVLWSLGIDHWLLIDKCLHTVVYLFSCCGSAKCISGIYSKAYAALFFLSIAETLCCQIELTGWLGQLVGGWVADRLGDY